MRRSRAPRKNLRSTFVQHDASSLWDKPSFWLTAMMLPMHIYLLWIGIEELFFGVTGFGAGRVAVTQNDHGHHLFQATIDPTTSGYVVAMLGASVALWGASAVLWGLLRRHSALRLTRAWIIQTLGVMLSLFATYIIVQAEQLFR